VQTRLEVAESADSPAAWERLIEALRKARTVRKDAGTEELLGRSRARHAWALARERERAGEFEDAVRLARRAMDTGSGLPGLSAYLAEVEKKDIADRRQQQFDKLSERAEFMEEDDPSHALGLWREALTYADRDADIRTAQEAVTRLSEGLRRGREKVESLRLAREAFEKARGAVARRNLLEAERLLKQALAYRPGFREAETELRSVQHDLYVIQGQRALTVRDHLGARITFARAVELNPRMEYTQRMLEKARETLAAFTPRLGGIFMLPDAESDRHGNPVVTRKGLYTDTESGMPYEIWLMRPPMEFVRIPAGTFRMGSPQFEKGRDAKESPLHEVRFSRAFYIGKYEVTQVQWKAHMGDNPSVHPGERHPVENVTWVQCGEFARRLTREARSKLPDTVFRLPSEAEWEYACRAGTRTRFHTGDTTEGLVRAAWFVDNSDHRTHPVGKRAPNPWGLYDMHGNVYEWCQDSLHHSYEGAPSDGSAWVDNPEGGIRIVRGGGFRTSAVSCRSASRWLLGYVASDETKGLRIVLMLKIP
jgi:formylglycine-generating enzyme required for sulfatase activity